MDQFFCALAQYAVHIYCLWEKYEKIGEKVTVPEAIQGLIELTGFLCFLFRSTSTFDVIELNST